MKNFFLKFFALLFFVLLTGTASFGQTSTIAGATATIINPLTISATNNLQFGDIAVSSSNGAVALSWDGSASYLGGVTDGNLSATPMPAQFRVTGDPNRAFSISLPVAVILVNQIDGISTMSAEEFTSEVGNSSVLDEFGERFFLVGATLYISAFQAQGNYSSIDQFVVTVNYN